MIVINEIEKNTIEDAKILFKEYLDNKLINIEPVEIKPLNGEKRFIIDPVMLLNPDWISFFNLEEIKNLNLHDKIVNLTESDFFEQPLP